LFLMLLTLYLCLRAWHKHSWRRLAGAVVVAILATLAKYNYAPVVGLPVLVALIMAWGRPWVRWVLALGVLGAVLGVLAVAFFPPLQLSFNT
jgi:4-amino-4-deoxy-L-arabinose transferase-like glycosyltransferase